MSKFVDYYQLLGVPVDATQREIRVAYVQHAKEQHPDVGGSHDMMQLLNRAYETLVDGTKRAAYDKIHRLESQSVAAVYKTPDEYLSGSDSSGLDMSDDEIDDFMNIVYAEYAAKPPEPALHKKAATAVRNHLRNLKQEKKQK